jgi:hypothetical protein
MSDVKEVLGVLFAAFCLILVIVLGVASVVYALTAYDCREYPDAETKMAGMSCYVLDGNRRWVSLSSYVHVVNISAVK